MSDNDSVMKQQALIALIPICGFLAVLMLGFKEIKNRRSVPAACVFYLLCATVFAAILIPYVTILLLKFDVMQWGWIAFAVIGGVILVWGVAYIALLIEMAFLRRV